MRIRDGRTMLRSDEVYQAVEQHLARRGGGRTEAFQALAQKWDAKPGTVSVAYYRSARKRAGKSSYRQVSYAKKKAKLNGSSEVEAVLARADAAIRALAELQARLAQARDLVS